MRNCSICRTIAKLKCQCSDEYFCEAHAGSHLLKRGPHNIIPIPNELEPEERRVFEAKIISRVNLIHGCRNDIMAQSGRLINQIEQLANTAFLKLNEFSSEYLKILACKQYDNNDFLKVKKIQQIELIRNYEVNAFESEHVFQFFKQEFVEEVEDPEIRKKERWS